MALFKNSLYPYGHYYKGEIVLSFYETKEVKEWVGFVTRYENVCHERWKISFLVINPDLDAGGPDYRLPNYNDTVQLEGSREAAFEQISFNMMKIVEVITIVVAVNCCLLLTLLIIANTACDCLDCQYLSRPPAAVGL